MDGNPVGHAHTNPILDLHVFEVGFGHVVEYAMNVITKNMFTMVDDEGYETSIFKEIIDHQCDTSKAVSQQEAWIISHNGN